MEKARELEEFTEFQIGKKLGEGSYGRVHKCKVNGKGGFAVKMLKMGQEGITSPLEMSIMASYHHPNLNTALSITHDANHVYIIQEAALCDLDNFLKTQRPIHKVRWFKQMLRGLYCLHTENIIHCDLKPSNVLVTKEGNLRLTDYSHSVIILGAASSFRHCIGSPRYSAPEVLAGMMWSKEVDIWSLGCIFYEMSTHVRFLDDIHSKTSNRDILRKLQSRSFGLKTFEDEQDKDLILNYMLQYKARDRYTCEEILNNHFKEYKQDAYCNYIIVKEPLEKDAHLLHSMLTEKTRDQGILILCTHIHKITNNIPLNLVKAEACFVLASKILKGYTSFALNQTISPHHQLLDMELAICNEAHFLLH